MFKKSAEETDLKQRKAEYGAISTKAPIMPPRHEGIRHKMDFPGKPSDERNVGNYGDNKKLIIGREIVLSGEISACETLIVEGCVETSTIKDCRKIEIAEGGIFKGEAEIEIAEIAGHFEGTILATNILLVRSTGIIKGTIRAERIEVELGGKISGQVQMELEKHRE